MSEPTQEQLKKLWDICNGYVQEQQISCVESIHQCDWVMLNAYDLLEKICDVVGYWNDSEERANDNRI